MYDPWDDFERYRLQGWKVRWCRLPDRLGHTTWHDLTVSLDPDQDQPQERGTVTHEVIHLERGPIPEGWEEWEERIVNELAARRLISLDDLVDGMVWAYDVDELAVVLWVDEATVRTRLQTLTEAEGREIQARLDEAETSFPDEVYDDVQWPDWGYDDIATSP
ncbi:hypothetical protein [Nocardioides sp. L-11A]|uniref:hypothetical protein n=1 Tax=Nocardioides sp. L-11A TaxID=3043848 RepID=UPI00249A9CF0|nr:hypothetical protein QJ852_10060 [Nocardioides sp. L-11A]